MRNATNTNTLETLRTLRAEVTEAAGKAQRAVDNVGTDAHYFIRASAADGEVTDVSTRSTLSALWRSDLTTKATALFDRMLAPDTVGAAATALERLESARPYFNRETWLAMSDTVNPESLGAAFASGTPLDVKRIDAAAKAISATVRFMQGESKDTATRAEKTKRAAAWTVAFKAAFLTQEDKLAAEALAAEALAKAEALEAAEALAAEALADSDAEALAAAKAAAKAETAFAEAAAKAKAAKAAALRKALAELEA